MNTDWDPALYLQFQKERGRPCADLLARVEGEPKTVLDLGCGPGSSAQAVMARWPRAMVTGVDSSPAMIEQARSELPQHEWLVGDLRLPVKGQFDLVLSNAAVQWVPQHASLIQALFDNVAPGGALAVQIPQYGLMPASRMVDAVFQELFQGWSGWDIDAVMTVETIPFYHDALSVRASRVELWQTTYFHAMPHHQAIVDMLRGTGLRPYLDRITPSQAEEFETHLVDAMGLVYPPQPDGAVLFPFQRLFFIAYSA